MQRNVLFIHHASNLGGAERHLCSLVGAIDKKYKVFFICQEPGPLSEALAKMAATTAFMPLPAWRKVRFFLANLAALKAMIDFCKTHHIDLICSNTYRVSPYAVWPAKFLKIPAVTIVQDFVPHDKLKKFKALASHILIAVSRSIADSFPAYPKDRVEIIYNGIDADALVAQAGAKEILKTEFPSLRNKRIVGMIAQIVPLKRHQLFLEAMQEVMAQVKDTAFVIIGESPDLKRLSLDDLRAYAKQLNMEDRVIFTGSRQDVPALLKSFSVLVHPADKEPFGRVIMEAMALGVPVVATASGGPSEIIEEASSGFLVQVGDKKAIVEKVIKLLNDAPLAAAIGAKGKERVRYMFNLKNTVCRINDVFGKL